MVLDEYKRRRDFSKTREPMPIKKESEGNTFAIQQHNARRMHYDLRLECNGVLKSWAIPKGPSLNPKDKRLAVMTEDHPMDYTNFEGIIPEGEYGAGSVIVWDNGYYEDVHGKIEDAIEKGRIEIILYGKKLKGKFALIRTRLSKDPKNWLFFKMKDKFASEEDITSKRPESVLSGKVISGKKLGTPLKDVEIDEQKIKIKNKDKVLFPPDVKKIELIEYYSKISQYMLLHIKERPIVLERFPNGINENRFYQKNTPEYYPDWIKRVAIKDKKAGETRYIICNDTDTLVYLANLACIPIHHWLSRVDKIGFPDKLILDIDPSDLKDFAIVVETAKGIKLIFDELGIKSYVMSTGSRGLHVAVALDRSINYEEARDFSKIIAEFIVNHDPKRLTIEQRIEKRRGRVFIDTYRNSFAQTAVAPYSIRPLENAPVAVPLEWEELDDFKPREYNIRNIWNRLEIKGDVWKDFFKVKYSVKKARERFISITDKFK